jgi:hypothetical protein
LRFSPVLIVAMAAAVLAGALFTLGWFQPVAFPDTAGYLRAAESAAPWGFERHPLYGWIVLGLESVGVDRQLVPALQFGAQVLAAMALAAAARGYGMEARAALALGLAALLSQALAIWGRALLPEMVAVSLLGLALALTLTATRERLFWPAALLIAAAVAASCVLRPIMLPAVAMLPLLYLLLCRMEAQGWRVLRAAALLALIVAPLLGQSAYRYREVGHFGLVSFGGFGSMGVAAQVLTADILPRLPEAQRPLAEQVLAAKQNAVDAQTAMPLFRNSSGERSFQTTALDGFDTLARNFDEILWGQISALRMPGESWVAFDARMGALGGAIARAAPERYGLWAIGATSRLVGRLMAYNAAFLLALAAFAVVALWNTARRGAALGGATGRSWTPLVLIVGAWVVSTSLLTVVVFPALRYTDTAGLLLTALPLYGLFLALAKTNSDDPA